MSRYMNVFVGTNDPPEAVQSWLEDTLSIQLKPSKNPHQLFLYVDEANNRWFDIGEHSLENDRELTFEDYRYKIGFVSNNPNKIKQWEEIQEFAHSVFDKLKTSQRYSLMLTDDVHALIEKYNP